MANSSEAKESQWGGSRQARETGTHRSSKGRIQNRNRDQRYGRAGASQQQPLGDGRSADVAEWGADQLHDLELIAPRIERKPDDCGYGKGSPEH